MLVEQLLIDGPQAVEIDVDGIEVQQGYTEFVGCGDGDGSGICHIVRHQIGDQGNLFLACGLRGLLYDLFGDNTVLHQTSG